jgi:uncharacterized protein YjbJ (UPF0337 family)
MNEDRIVGTARNLGGQAQEGFGRVTGDTRSQVEGIVNQAAGTAQELYGQAKETAAAPSTPRTMSARPSRSVPTPRPCWRFVSAGSSAAWDDGIEDRFRL